MPETCGKSYLDLFVEEMPYILEAADTIITVSNYSKQDILKYFDVPESKIKALQE